MRAGGSNALDALLKIEPLLGGKIKKSRQSAVEFEPEMRQVVVVNLQQGRKGRGTACLLHDRRFFGYRELLLLPVQYMLLGVIIRPERNLEMPKLWR